MSIYDDDNYFITFGERRQSREEWIAFGDETDEKSKKNSAAPNNSSDTDSSANNSPGCLVLLLIALTAVGVVLI